MITAGGGADLTALCWVTAAQSLRQGGMCHFACSYLYSSCGSEPTCLGLQWWYFLLFVPWHVEKIILQWFDLLLRIFLGGEWAFKWCLRNMLQLGWVITSSLTCNLKSISYWVLLCTHHLFTLGLLIALKCSLCTAHRHRVLITFAHVATWKCYLCGIISNITANLERRKFYLYLFKFFIQISCLLRENTNSKEQLALLIYFIHSGASSSNWENINIKWI